MALQRLVHLVDPGERGELRHLRQHFLVIDRIERILLLDLDRQQPEEIVLAECGKPVLRGGTGRRRGAR